MDTVERAPGTSGADEGGGHGLRHGALSLLDSSVMGVAGVAPAYSIAASTAVLVGAVSVGGPAALLYCGIAMFGIVWAFNYLGRSESNAGASYAWVRRALHPVLGYIAGWALVASALIFMVAGAYPAGSTFLGLFSNSAANNVTLVTIVGSIVFLLMIAAVIAGVTITAKIQVAMSSIELAILVVFAILMLVHGHDARNFSWSWLSPSVFHSSSVFFGGALVAAFYYWGWDVTANLNEETKEAKVTPGLGGIIGVIVVFVLFEVFTIGTNMVLTNKIVANNAGDVLLVLGQTVWHGVGGKLLVVAVVLSTVATLETTIIQVTRTMFSMGRDGTLPKALGVTHAKRQTPVVATVVVAVISLGLFVASNYVGSIGTILSDAINAIGLQIAIYYALAGFSVVILYRKKLFTGANYFFFAGLWPLVGAVFMAVMFEQTIPTLNATTLIVGLGSMALGLIPMIIYWVKGRPYFKMPSPEERDIDYEPALTD
jgi:amino acid transporter